METGYYWVQVDGLEDPEPARFDAAAQRWELIGSEDECEDDPEYITVLGPCTPPHALTPP